MTFGDAVVAIAITLIVLPLVDTAMDVDSAAGFFSGHWDTLLAAALSFVVVAVTWHAHRKLFIGASGYNATIFWLEVVWLAAEVFLPVATVLDVLGDGVGRAALGTYIGDLLLIVSTMRFQGVVLERTGLVPRSRGPWWARWHVVVTWCVILVLALTFPGVGGYWMLLALVDALVVRMIGLSSARRGSDG